MGNIACNLRVRELDKKTLDRSANFVNITTIYYCKTNTIRNIQDIKGLTDGTIRDIKKFDRSTEVREDEGDAAYHTS